MKKLRRAAEEECKSVSQKLFPSAAALLGHSPETPTEFEEELPLPAVLRELKEQVEKSLRKK